MTRMPLVSSAQQMVVAAKQVADELKLKNTRANAANQLQEQMKEARKLRDSIKADPKLEVRVLVTFLHPFHRLKSLFANTICTCKDSPHPRAACGPILMTIKTKNCFFDCPRHDHVLFPHAAPTHSDLLIMPAPNEAP